MTIILPKLTWNKKTNSLKSLRRNTKIILMIIEMKILKKKKNT